MQKYHILYLKNSLAELPDFLLQLQEDGWPVQVAGGTNWPGTGGDNFAIVISELPADIPLTDAYIAEHFRFSPEVAVLFCLQHEQMQQSLKISFGVVSDFILFSARKEEAACRINRAIAYKKTCFNMLGEQEKTRQLSSLELAQANIALLGMKESLEQKNAELSRILNEFSDNRDAMRALIDASNAAILLADKQQNIMIVNQRFEEFFEKPAQEIVGQPIDQVMQQISPCFRSRAAFNSLYQKLLQEPDCNADFMHELGRRRLELAHENLKILALFSIRVENRQRRKIGRLWSFVDMTSWWQSDALLHTIVDISPMPFIVTRFEDGKILYANKPLGRLLGFDVANLDNLKTVDVYENPADRDEILAILERDGAVSGHEVKIRRKDGTPLWMIISLATTVLNDEKIIVGALYDIDERRRTEEALRESEGRFRQLMENIDLLFFMRDYASRKILYVSPAFEKIFGRSPDDFPLDSDIGSLIHPEDRDRIMQNIHSEIAEKTGFEYRILHPRDGIRWIKGSLFPIRNADGEIYRICGVSADVTERKKFLSELEKSNEELRIMQAQLVQSEKMAALGNLVAGIAHEINTPVGAIHSMNDTMRRAVFKLKETLEKCGDCLEENAAKVNSLMKLIEDANKVIDSGSSRVTDIVRRLKSFARLDEAELKEADIHAGIDDTLVLLHHEIKHKAEIIKNYAKLPPIACFPGRLNQVFLNLLMNAEQAIQEKGTITITTAIENEHVKIAIADTGIGIAASDLPKVFDPGFTTKGVGVGTGLGLSICYQIMQDHHGKIEVISTPGKGTCFTVIFPANLDELIPDQIG